MEIRLSKSFLVTWDRRNIAKCLKGIARGRKLTYLHMLMFQYKITFHDLGAGAESKRAILAPSPVDAASWQSHATASCSLYSTLYKAAEPATFKCKIKCWNYLVICDFKQFSSRGTGIPASTWIQLYPLTIEIELNKLITGLGPIIEKNKQVIQFCVIWKDCRFYAQVSFLWKLHL